MRELSVQCGCSEKTVYRAARGEEVLIKTARKIVKALRGYDMTELLLDDLPARNGAPDVASGPPPEWKIVETVSPWLTLSNQIQYRVFRLQHRSIPNEFARAKCYDLDNVSFETHEAATSHLLTRHAQICRTLAPSDYFPINQSVSTNEDEKHAWVIDTWPPGTCLSKQQTSIDKGSVVSVAKHLATALSEAHRHEIIVRDLHPDSVYFDAAIQRLTILDLELAKLSDGSPTVANGELIENRYRAPECAGPKFDHTVDIYSWARVVCFLLTGDPNEFPTTSVPAAILGMLQAAQSKSYRKRPGSFNDILWD